MSHESAALLENAKAPIREIGVMLGDAWRLNKELVECISTDEVDRIYDAAIAAGALGGKLLGAGGGGFMLVFAEPRFHGHIREALHDLIDVAFRTDSAGSTIVVYEPDGLDELRGCTNGV